MCLYYHHIVYQYFMEILTTLKVNIIVFCYSPGSLPLASCIVDPSPWMVARDDASREVSSTDQSWFVWGPLGLQSANSMWRSPSHMLGCQLLMHNVQSSLHTRWLDSIDGLPSLYAYPWMWPGRRRNQWCRLIISTELKSWKSQLGFENELAVSKRRIVTSSAFDHVCENTMSSKSGKRCT